MAIKIDYDGLAQQSAALKNYSASYENLCSRMSALSGQIGSSWEGKASAAFTEMMQKYVQQGRILKEIIDAMGGYADEAGETFQTLDQQCASEIRNSF